MSKHWAFKTPIVSPTLCLHEVLQAMGRRCLVLIEFLSHAVFVQLLKEYTPSSLEEAKYIDLSGKDIGRRQIVILNHLTLKHCLFLSVAIERLGICRRLQTLVLCGNSIDALRNVDCCRQLWKIDLSGNRVSASSALTRTLQSPLYPTANSNSLCCAIFEWDGLRFMAIHVLTSTAVTSRLSDSILRCKFFFFFVLLVTWLLCLIYFC